MVASKLTPLQDNVKIVNPDGTPTPYLIQLLQQLYEEKEITDVLAGDAVPGARQVLAGAGLTGGGALTADVTLTADTQAILNLVSTTQGAILYRGAALWSALVPGSYGDVLTSGGGAANPAWAAPAGGGGAVAWGGITGVLSSQTDLQTELDAKLAILDDTTNFGAGSWRTGPAFETLTIGDNATEGTVSIGQSPTTGFFEVTAVLSAGGCGFGGIDLVTNRMRIYTYGSIVGIQFTDNPYVNTYKIYHEGVLGFGVGLSYDVGTGILSAATGPIQDGVIDGCVVVYSGVGLIFDMSAGSFYLNETLYTALSQSVTLAAADPTNPRVDSFYVDNSGTFGAVTGTPAVAPLAPDVDDATQLLLGTATIPAAATDLIASIPDTAIYHEGTEWPPTVVGAAINAVSTNNPHAGTKDIEATAATSGDYVQLIAGTAIAFGTDGNLLLWIRSKAAWGGGRLKFFWYLAGRRIGKSATLRDGTYGFDSSNITTYQLVVIPKSDFDISSSTDVDELRIKATSAVAFGFYIDDIVLQTPSDGSTSGGSTSTGITETAADARYLRQSLNLSDVADAATARENIEAFPLRLAVETVAGTPYTFVLADASKHKRFTGAGAVVATVPPGVFSTGDRIRGTAAGAGGVTLAPGVGVTLNSRGGGLASAGQYAVFEIECVASDEFDILGDVA